MPVSQSRSRAPSIFFVFWLVSFRFLLLVLLGQICSDLVVPNRRVSDLVVFGHVSCVLFWSFLVELGQNLSFWLLLVVLGRFRVRLHIEALGPRLKSVMWRVCYIRWNHRRRFLIVMRGRGDIFSNKWMDWAVFRSSDVNRRSLYIDYRLVSGSVVDSDQISTIID